MAPFRFQRHYLILVIGCMAIYAFLNSEMNDEQQSRGTSLLVLTVATKESNAFKRFRRSAQVNGLPLKVVGLGGRWKGLGHAKVTQLAKELETYKNDSNKVILFADAYDVLLNGRVEDILQRFEKSKARILFSAEKNCYPQELASRYPPAYGIMYLNSGLFMGYAPELYRMVTHAPFASNGNDQKYYSKIYVNPKLRQEFGIQLDHRAEIFQSLFLAMNDIEIRYNGTETYVYNKLFDTTPLAVHTNGPIKPLIDTLANYIPKVWNPVHGCVTCLEDTLDLSPMKTEDYPVVVMGIFAEKPTDCFNSFLEKIFALSYPKEKIIVVVHDVFRDQIEALDATTGNRSKEFASLKYCAQPNLISNWFGTVECRETAMDECVEKKCDFYLNVDSSAHLDNPDTLRLLIEQNRSVVAPMLKQIDADKWNFRGSWSARWDREHGFYPPHMDFIKNNRTGLWIVPLVTSCYLVRADVIQNPQKRPSYDTHKYKRRVNTDVAFSLSLHKNDVDLLVSNRFHYGHLKC